jgi:hypothetical protein
MTTFNELYDLTVELTKRPELVTLTQSAIRTATLRAHHTDFFRRDLSVTTLPYVVQADAYYYDFPTISTSLTRLRTIKNVYSVTQGTPNQTEQLEYRESDDLFDRDGNPRRYMYTLIGDTLRCYFDIPTGLAQVYFFQNPIITSGTYNSWIADAYADDLAGWAAAIVMSRTGFMEMAARYQEDYVKPLKEQLIASHLLGSVS